jgi:hypothetical protein
MLAKVQESAKIICEQQNSSPSPTTILKSVNNSGAYMCSQHSNIEIDSPSAIFHENLEPIPTPSCQYNMMQHRNNLNNVCNQQENNNQLDDEEGEENLSQKSQQQRYSPYHSNSYCYSQESTQQQADQHSIELRMNNLGNEQNQN